MLLLVWLAGMAVAAATPTAGHLMDVHIHVVNGVAVRDGDQFDPTLVAIWIFFAGGLLGGVYYLILAGILQAAGRALGSQGTYRRTRHVLAFASVPLALSLVLLPLKLAIFGGDVFRTGGADAGGGGDVFIALQIGFAVWSLGLLVIGVRAVHGWTWGRAAGSVALAAVLPAAVAVLALAV